MPSFGASRRTALTLALTSAVALASLSAHAGNGPSPAFGVPEPLWGELQPIDTGQLSPERDRTSFNEFMQFYQDAGLKMGIRAEGSWVFVATNWGLDLWDASAPAAPVKAGSLKAQGFPIKAVGEEAKTPVLDVAVAPGNDGLAALACDGGMGLAIVNTSVKAALAVLYQDAAMNAGKSGSRVHAAAIGKTSYAFYVAGDGVHIYNMGAAAQIASPPCVENAPDAASACPSVYLGRGLTGTYIHPTTHTETEKTVSRIAGVDHYVITGSLPGLDIWDVSDPAQPVRLGGGLDKASVQGGVAMWKSADSYFAAAIVNKSFLDASIPFTLDIYDVTPIIKMTKTTLDAPVASMPAPTKVLAPSELTNVQVGFTGAGHTLLYFTDGASPIHDLSSVGDRHEQLYDVSIPSMPRDITPPAKDIGGMLTDYWGHSYQYGWVRPAGGVLVGNHFYRAAHGTLDVHAWTPPPGGPGGPGGQDNLPPEIKSSPPQTVTVLEEYEYQIIASDPEGADLTFTLAEGPTGMSLSPSGLIKWTPDSSAPKLSSVAVDVSDGTNTVPHTWSIEVLPVASDLPAGCGCSVPGAGPGQSSALAAAALLGLALARRKPRATSAE